MVSQTTTTAKNTVNDSPLHGDTGTRNGRLSQLYASNGVLKIWKTATEHLQREASNNCSPSRIHSGKKNSSNGLQNPPQSFPETVPQTGPSAGKYQYRDADFWTCGFFPGSLYCLLERSVKYPQQFLADGALDGEGSQHRELLRQELPGVCRAWSEPLHEMANRTDTHDMGFIIEPALRRDFELTGDERSLASIVRAAKSLASRYSETTRAIRSWDTLVNNRHRFTDKDKDFLVIIDSMCNLDILYYAGHHGRDQRLIDIATTHAHTVCKTHLRRENSSSGSKYGELSTCHVANMCPATGQVVRRFTAQGYSDTSTWARGQSWAILGFAQAYTWTKDVAFLHTACGLAEHFMSRMESSPPCVAASGKVGRYVPLWDFDAPVDEKHAVRDSAAGVIAANGMLVVSSALASLGHFADAQRFLESSLAIVEDTLALCYAADGLELVVEQRQDGSARVVARSLEQEAEPFDALLRCATANYNRDWTDKYYNHGLVYGDYYLLEYGNRLLQLGYM